jgi:hypothetical protein
VNEEAEKTLSELFFISDERPKEPPIINEIDLLVCWHKEIKLLNPSLEISSPLISQETIKSVLVILDRRSSDSFLITSSFESFGF